MREQNRLRLGGLDALRGFAATIVILYHCARHVGRIHGVPMLVATTRFGHAGVDLFFVLSGFVILFTHHQDIGKPHHLRRYAARRFGRVMPTYWVALALTVLAALGHGVPAAADLALAATLLPSDRAPLLGVAWTLQYEIVFYALFGMLILRRGVGAALMAGWVAATIIFAWTGSSPRGFPQSVFGVYNLEFLFGMSAAFMLRRDMIRHPARIGGAAIALLALAALAEDAGVMDGYANAARLAYGAPSALLIAAVAQADRSGDLHVAGWMRALGSASYSIYLFQFLMIGAFWRAWTLCGLEARSPALVSFVLLVGAALGGGLLASRLVERPLLAVFGRRRSVANADKAGSAPSPAPLQDRRATTGV